jgi:uncharacterized protein (TIGR03437 family)
MKSSAIALVLTAGICFAQSAVTVTSVQNGASFTNRITPGAFATIKGTGFVSAAQSSNIVPVPTSLGGVTVSIAGVLCPIYYVNPTQINFLVPWKTALGPYPLIVTANGQTVGPMNILITGEAPGIFQYGANRAVAQNFNDNYSLNGPSAPVDAGAPLIVYVNGIGQVSNTPADGDYSPFSPRSQGLYNNTATIGGVPAGISFIGLTPGLVGLAQANITVPPLPSGDYPLILNISGLESTSALVSVKGTGSTLPLVFNPLSTVAALTNPQPPPAQGATHTSANVVVSGNYAYLCDANGIAVIDVTNSASPQALSFFGQNDMAGAGQGCTLYQNVLLAFTSGQMDVYSIAVPAQPQRIGQNQFYSGNTFISGTTAYVSTQSYTTDAMFDVTSQTGDFYTYDLTNPLLPKLDAQLVQNFFQQGSANTSPRGGLTVFNNQTAIVLGTSATSNTTNGQALWATIDVTTPTKPAVLSQTPIPGASIALNLDMQGTQALVAGNTAGVQNPFPADPATGAHVNAFAGNLTLHLMDFTNPLSPTIVSTLATPYQSTSGNTVTSLGKGFYAVTIGPPLTDLDGPTILAVVDARKPTAMAVYPEFAVDNLQGLFLSNGKLYTVSNGGLTIYSVTLP